MQTSRAGQKILVSGASGFLASHILNAFLSAGYRVRGTVRSKTTGERVKKTHPNFSHQLELVVVEDIQKPGAFDEAVRGVDGVIHTASPFFLSVKDNERDLLLPAIRGTTEILESVTKYAPQVKRVVITSSFAAIMDSTQGPRPGYTYTENDWNSISYEEAKAGDSATAYCASKTFAERLAWDYAAKNHPPFTLATICPPMVYGPLLQYQTTINTLGESAADIYQFINGSCEEVPQDPYAAFVDVRDCAEVHLRAYENPGSQRYYCGDGEYIFQEIVDIIRDEFPELRDRTPEGSPGVKIQRVYNIDNSRVKTGLGMEFRSLRETIVDTVRSLLELEKEAEET